VRLRHVGVGLAMVCSLLLAGCGGGGSSAGGTATSPAAGAPASSAPAGSAGSPSPAGPAGPVIQGREVTLTAPAGAVVDQGEAPWQQTFHVGKRQGLVVQLNEQDCTCDLGDDQAGVDAFAATVLKLNTFGLTRQPDATVGGHLFAHLAGRKDGYAHQTYGTYDHGLLITIEFIVDPHALPPAQAEPMIGSILASARFA
jgi:hypothetical protein